MIPVVDFGLSSEQLIGEMGKFHEELAKAGVT